MGQGGLEGVSRAGSAGAGTWESQDSEVEWQRQGALREGEDGEVLEREAELGYTEGGALGLNP